jgi:prepilin-type processing-associated H-X9-DG protein
MRRTSSPRKGRNSPPLARQQVLHFLELMVVVATIVLPIVMLLLATARARDHAQLIQCASNMRRIHLALLSYAAQNEGELPPPSFSWDPQGPGVRWAIHVDAVGQYSWTMGSLWACLPGGPKEHARLFMCPADAADGDDSPNGSAGYVRNFSYNFNVWMRGGDPELWQTPRGTGGIRMGRIVDPHEKILIAEERNPHDGCFDGYWPLAARHLHRGNQCFADGHVELFDPTPFATLRPFDKASPTISRYVRLTSAP